MLEAYVEDVRAASISTASSTTGNKVDENALHDLERIMEQRGRRAEVGLDDRRLDRPGQPAAAGWRRRQRLRFSEPALPHSQHVHHQHVGAARAARIRARSLSALPPFVAALPRDATINVCSAAGIVLDALVGEGHREFGLDPKTARQEPRNRLLSDSAGLPGVVWRRQPRPGSTKCKTCGADFEATSGSRASSLLAVRTSPCTVFCSGMRTGQVHVLDALVYAGLTPT